MVRRVGMCRLVRRLVFRVWSLVLRGVANLVDFNAILFLIAHEATKSCVFSYFVRVVVIVMMEIVGVVLCFGVVLWMRFSVIGSRRVHGMNGL